MIWHTVYDLRTDTRYVSAVQAATLHRPGLGLKPEPALFGSSAWWDAIERGQLPTHVIEGTVVDVFWSGHADFPEFAMIGEDGARFELERKGDQTRHVEGLRVRLSYVIQHLKDDAIVLEGESSANLVPIRIDIEESDRRSSASA